jgi:hypothetical protein
MAFGGIELAGMHLAALAFPLLDSPRRREFDPLDSLVSLTCSTSLAVA